jgi:GH15 family glucan-1,4-alpha-glucosidase
MSRKIVTYKLPFRGRYKPISGYGVIGNTRTCALVGYDGSIDWCCFPKFDSPSTFASILDRERGGRWAITPTGAAISHQGYVKDTNVLKTYFESNSGSVELIDFMPCHKGSVWSSPPEIHRIVKCVSGKMDLEVWLEPRFDYGRATAKIDSDDNGYTFRNSKEELVFSASAGSFTKDDGAVRGVLSVRKGDRVLLILSYGESSPRSAKEYFTEMQLRRTVKYWRGWASRLRYRGKWKENVVRSALALRLLVYSPTGAIVAAATTSLPEAVGYGRNWDYRYSWIRDSAFSLWAFHVLGSFSEAEHYIHWLINNNPALDKDLHLMYTVDGTTRLTEHELNHLEGYKSSAPVRVGNAASMQLQLDAHGCILDALYFSSRYGMGISEEMYYRFVKPIAVYLCDNWMKKGNGIWEIRGRREHYVYTKAWCCVGLQRACKIADLTGHHEDTARWNKVLNEIKREVRSKGVDAEQGYYKMRYGSRELDASLLLLPLIGFVSVDDDAMKHTVDAIRKKLSRNGLLYRYKVDDGLEGKEGSFTVCNFWLVAVLARQGRIREAEQLMDKLVSLGSPLGLFAEELDPDTGELLGNFPQAFSHMGLITAAREIMMAKKKAILERAADK